MNIDRLFDEKLRQTGRTTRMLEKAKKLAQEGRAVYILAANRAERSRLKALLGINDLGISVEALSALSNFDWNNLSLRGAHPNCIVLVDHYALEREIQRRLEGLGTAIWSVTSDISYKEKVAEEEFHKASERQLNDEEREKRCFGMTYAEG